MKMVGFSTPQNQNPTLGRRDPERGVMATPTPPETAAEKLLKALKINDSKLAQLTQRMKAIFEGKVEVEPKDLANYCFHLARGIDYALSNDHVPESAYHLSSVIKHVFSHRSDSSLQSSISVLMISTKNACKNGWFQGTDAVELLSMANELCSNFCLEVSATTDTDKVLDTISKIMPRFYPKLIFNRLIVSFEVKPGYDILMSDFHIGRNQSEQELFFRQERICLFVVQTDDLETSSCLINPPNVSFLVNGKGVGRRCNNSLDAGPQFPSDITKVLKYGTNIIQAAGYFKGNCLIAIAFVGRNDSLGLPTLRDHVLSNIAADSEIIEGPSRITLNCPISFKRIKTPVKGHLCKHYQCFDYENFLEMNSRKPSWRCPCCNQSTSFGDIRIDRIMVKILGEVREDVVDVEVFADGSWKVAAATKRSVDQLRTEIQSTAQDGIVGYQANRSSRTADTVDLTMEDVNDSMYHGPVDVNGNNRYEPEDKKPFQRTEDLPISQVSSMPAHSNFTTSTSHANVYHPGTDVWSSFLSSNSPSNAVGVPTMPDHHADQSLVRRLSDVAMVPAVTDAFSPAHNREQMYGNALQHTPLVRLPMENGGRLQQIQSGSSIINDGTERPQIPRNIVRNPIAIQALPVQTQPAVSQRMRPNVLNPTAMISNGFSSSYHPVHSEEFNASNCDMVMLEAPRNAEIPVTETRGNPDQWQSRGPTSQQVVGLPAPNLTSLRLSSDRGNVGGYSSVAQQGPGLPARHTAHFGVPSNRVFGNNVPPVQQVVGLAAPNLRMHMSQPNAIPQSSHVSSMQPQQPSHNFIGSGNRPSLVQAANQVAAHASRLQTAAGNPQFSWINSSQMTANNMRLSGSSPMQTTTGVMPAAVRVDNSQQMPPEQNWRPTGRMRGSLTGDAYSAALNQYLVPSTQQLPTRMTAPASQSGPSYPNIIARGTGGVSQPTNNIRGP